MPEIHTLSPSSGTVLWGYIGGPQQAVLRVKPGDSVILKSVSGSPQDSVPSEWIPDSLREIHERTRDRGPGVHILTGPIHVEGAEPGDTLAVHIEDVRVDALYGFNYMGPMSGIFYNEMDDPDTAIIKIDAERKLGVWGPAKFPLKPFFGIMGVAPPDHWERITSVTPGRYGGNMDNRELTAGSVLYLPVMRTGGLFYAGDGHGAQGDGEIDVTAIEVSLEGRFRFGLLKGTEQRWPYAQKHGKLISMGFDEDLAAALQAAANQMIGLLQEKHELTRKEAYRICSIAADFHITQAVNGIKGVHGIFDTSILAD
ncbi:acetamidase/formamidase family protein [Paenibacillus sp. S150]|uniref:acetamidase/formamidase family protein n=1 Tax=Paenibacillus sp. S150 TaxID=2749826 RepID=UPI001C561B48|nr:acetamidase/formamidase family protein [Paenibacillus sp. S150]MBW4081176.1 acetamidase/formamidase family protein [Paenibacillus sp. S150]